MEDTLQPRNEHPPAAGAAAPPPHEPHLAASDLDLEAAPPAASDTSAAGKATAAKDEVVSERVRDMADRLKPVALAAEEMTARAVNLSAKGLSKLGAYLDQRRQQRAAQRDGGDAGNPL